jgi:Cytochrome C and Quinol oxidase polypeptide I
MGAVFALFSAWYFWAPKITGLISKINLGKTHFWLMFAGVNLTFFPQHFLGLQGMPRRISDYPDAFTGWNLISSIGSAVSGLLGVIIFLLSAYNLLISDESANKNYSKALCQADDAYNGSKKENQISLEWNPDSPPKGHVFTSIPVQSSFFKYFIANIITILNKLCTFKYFITIFWGFCLFYCIKNFLDLENNIYVTYLVNTYLDKKTAEWVMRIFYMILYALTRVFINALINTIYNYYNNKKK